MVHSTRPLPGSTAAAALIVRPDTAALIRVYAAILRTLIVLGD